MTTLAFQSAIDIATLIRNREMSAIECLDYFRKRIERFNSQVNAVVVFDWDRAVLKAQQADDAIARGDVWGPLHGVPMTVKEMFDLKGHATTWGDPALRDCIASEDDLAVQRLEAAGAIVFGKTNVPRRLMDIQTYNDIYGTTNNPWDLTRVTGGSSGGSAAALAAGLTGLEFGSDIGGSIRNPAHHCGVYGHKPTYGLVGVTRTAAPGNFTKSDLGVHGPLARSGNDLALAMSLLSFPGIHDAPYVRANLPRPHKSLKDFRVALWSSDDRVAVATEISDRCQHVGDALAKLGASVSDTARPTFDATKASSIYRKLLDGATNPLTELRHAEWRDLDNERQKIRLQWRAFFNDWDIVIAPVSATTAFKHDHSAYQGRTLNVDGKVVPYFQQIFWASLATLSYLPATCFPTGVSREGLPIGLQAIGKGYDDLITIDFARQLGDEIGGFTAPPGFED